jgi:nucleoside-diphosphate-sugar epimerase
MKLLITGATGFIGQYLCDQSLQQGFNVRIAVRKTKVQSTAAEVAEIGDIDGNVDWNSALSNVDVVVHLAARVHIIKEYVVNPIAEFSKTNVEGTLNLAFQASHSGVKRFIYVSTIGVNGAQSKLPFTELDAPTPHNPYSISKIEAELGLQKIAAETGMEVVIIRPPLVYGPYAPGNFASLIRVLKRGIPLPLGAIHNQRSFVYVGNLVSFIMRCIEHPAAANQVFLVSDGHDISTTELLRECAKALGVSSRLIPVPQKLIEFVANVLGKGNVAKSLCGNLQVDITKARTLLGWEPPFSVEQGLKVTADGFRNIDS